MEIAVGDLVSEEQRTLIAQHLVLPIPLLGNGQPAASLAGESPLELEAVYDEITAGGIASQAGKQTLREVPVQDPAAVILNSDVIPWVAQQRAGRSVSNKPCGHPRSEYNDRAHASDCDHGRGPDYEKDPRTALMLAAYRAAEGDRRITDRGRLNKIYFRILRGYAGKIFPPFLCQYHQSSNILPNGGIYLHDNYLSPSYFWVFLLVRSRERVH